MNGSFEFQYPWVLALLTLLPFYAFLQGRVGKLSALLFSSADIARSAGGGSRGLRRAACCCFCACSWWRSV